MANPSLKNTPTMRPLKIAAALVCLGFPFLLQAQNPEPTPDDLLGEFELEQSTLPLCFGIRDITDPRALEICDALYLRDNVRARELAEAWVRSEPNHPGAQFALAEVLFNVEANLPRALFHLKRAEELTDFGSLGRALASGLLEWHYLTLSQLSYVHQLMGDQISSLAYLDKLEEIYGQETESFRGWPLIKLKEYEAARVSANLVLQDSDSPRDRARAWNTLCAVELASLQPRESLFACDRAIDEDGNIASAENDSDTVYLVNASEVSLSLLKIDEAENFLDRAARYPNPDSVADPWVYKLYITMNQGRFEDARNALDRMLLWRENQVPVVGVMNRAEHLLASAMFLILTGYGQDAARLSLTALNEPDRNGSFSADDEQKDSMAALLNMIANRTAIEVAREQMSTLDLSETLGNRLSILGLRLSAWRAGRRAASLFADHELMLNRFRPYAPLDVHIPEWIEPELIALLGTGVSRALLDDALRLGAFTLNEGYYHAYVAEAAALDRNWREVMSAGAMALSLLPAQEVLLQARLHARLGNAAYRLREFDIAIEHYQTALTQDPGIIRRLGESLPVIISDDGSEVAGRAARLLSNSPRFSKENTGLRLEIKSTPELSVCLFGTAAEPLRCVQQPVDPTADNEELAARLVRSLHQETFSLGYEISDAQIALLMGSSVILSAQRNDGREQNRRTLFQ
ncbi:MAG: tetratricopeptide repeat protein [Pseudohongiellaceae bacterium]